VTSFINVRYGNVAVEIIPQGTAFCYSFAVVAKGPSANAIQSEMEMRPLQYMVASILQDSNTCLM